MKRLGTTIAIALVAFSGAFSYAPAAYAQIPVTDAGNITLTGADVVQNSGSFVQNTLTAIKAVTGCDLRVCGLNGIVWAISKQLIQVMTRQMVNWINSGFNGSASYAGNQSSYLGNVGFVVAGAFINQLATNGYINSPFQSAVAAQLQQQYLLQTQQGGYFALNQFTLGQYSPNPLAFMTGSGGFSSLGGWNAWYAMTTQPQNNIYGASTLARNELNRQVSVSQGLAQAQLGWGQGFMSFCGKTSGLGNTDKVGNLVPFGAVSPATVSGSGVNGAQTCQNSNGTFGTIQTPGSIIQGQLNKTLGLSGDTLVTASEFDQIIGALMNQLVVQVVGATGLLGSSQSASGGSILTQATDPSQYESSANGAGQALANAQTTQQTNLSQYQQDWQTISDITTQAGQYAQNCAVPPDNAGPAYENAVQQSTNGLARAGNALSNLTQIQNETNDAINAASTTAEQTAAIDYQNFLLSSSTPSAVEMSAVHQQSQDDSQTVQTDDLSKHNLYSQMEEIINVCSLFAGVTQVNPNDSVDQQIQELQQQYAQISAIPTTPTFTQEMKDNKLSDIQSKIQGLQKGNKLQ